MRVLVVHDRPPMLEAVANLVAAEAGARALIDGAGDLMVARDFLGRYHYDLAIVDLTLPAVAGVGEPALQNADWLLAAAFTGDLKTPADVIAMSYDGDAIRDIRTSIGEHVLAVIPEDPDGRWRRLLKEKIAYVSSTRRARQLAANQTNDLDVAIVTALDKEASPYDDLLELATSTEFAGAREFVGNDRTGRVRRGILVSVGTSGQAPTAALTQAVLTQFRPRLAIMTGFCGGLKGKLDLGDVAFFKSTAPWDYGKWIDAGDARVPAPRFLPRGEAVPMAVGEAERVVRELMNDQHPFADTTVAMACAVSSGGVISPALREVAAGSGSSVVTSTNVLGRIVEVNDAIHAVDMESHAFYSTCRRTPVRPPDYLCIKGVADFCNGEKDDRLHAACSFLSASLALDIVRRRYDFEAGGWPR